MIPSMPPSIKQKIIVSVLYNKCQFGCRIEAIMRQKAYFHTKKSHSPRSTMPPCAPYHDELGLNLKHSNLLKSADFNCVSCLFILSPHVYSHHELLLNSYIHIISLWLPPIYKGLCISIRLTICKYTEICQQSFLVEYAGMIMIAKANEW